MAYACPLLGGDTVATPGPLTLSITALGDVPSGAFVPRPGARAGDVLFVSGTIGDAALGLDVRRRVGWTAALGADDRAFLLDRYLLPRPRLALTATLSDHARSAMDVSDGLVGDLAKMLALDGLTVDVPLEAVPLSAAVQAAVASDSAHLQTALTGGDDYEILCAVPPEMADAFAAASEAAGVTVARLGIAVAASDPPRFLLPSGASLEIGAKKSFQHFV